MNRADLIAWLTSQAIALINTDEQAAEILWRAAFALRDLPRAANVVELHSAQAAV